MIGVRPSSLYFSGYIGNDEVFITRYIIENLEQGATFLDVGANIGFFALLASKIVGPSGNVIAFEPAPLNYEYLKRNAENIKNIACYDIALHDMNGKSVLHDFGPYNNFYNSLGDENKLRDALVDIRNTEPSQDVTVFTQTLDSFCTSHNVHPDMIKIDTEETEDIIIEAGLDTIEKYKPDIIFEMLNFSIKEGRLEKLILEITPFGYSCYQFTNEGLCKISSIGDINFKFYNFLLTTTSNSDR
jgi:FkbM family methyltransferase